MGYICHHTIVVTGEDYPHSNLTPLTDAYTKAVVLFGKLVSNKILGHCNGYTSFFIAPDDSKEGWKESDSGDVKREEFKEFLKSMGCAPSWVEVTIGDEAGDPNVVDHSDNLSEDEG